MNCTNVFSRNIKAYNSGVRFIVNQGGARSSKTYSILQLALIIAIKHQGASAKKISVISESIPHLKKGVISDFEKILKGENAYNPRKINISDHSYHFGDSMIEFFSAEDSGKVTGPSRDIVFFNEVNNVPYSIFDAAIVRTTDCVFCDYNPTHEFYIHDEILKHRSSEVAFIQSTYKDNEFLHTNLVKDIESRKDRNENWWKVYGLGELGNLEGLIFPSFTLVDDMPDADGRIHGMDFGFTNDPTTLIDIRLHGGGLYLDEMMYQTAMTTGDIINHLKGVKFEKKKLVADSSDPKTIEEIRRGGFNIHPAVKGGDSIRAGIDLIKQYPLFITKRSTNIIKEARNYKWKIDRSTGKPLNEPIDIFNHGWDAVRYGLRELVDKPKQSAVRFNF